jgi:hypothetical protein
VSKWARKADAASLLFGSTFSWVSGNLCLLDAAKSVVIVWCWLECTPNRNEHEDGTTPWDRVRTGDQWVISSLVSPDSGRLPDESLTIIYLGPSHPAHLMGSR